MTLIQLNTVINAPRELCFDLSRSVEVHLNSTKKTYETVVEGRNSGLFELGDIVTWRAKHFGIYQRLTVKITQLDTPNLFEDTMLKGAFRSMHHLHIFKSLSQNQTLMEDQFHYTVPYGLIGKTFDFLILKKYMTRFLEERNKTIKSLAESGIQVI